MSNKKIMKEVFDKKLNIDVMHDEIITKIEKKQKQPQINKKYILVPLILIIITILLIPNISSNDKKSEYQNINKSENDIININAIEDKNRDILYDIDGRIVDKNQEELALKFSFINTLKIPLDSVRNTRILEMYGSSNLDSENYNTLIGYNLVYVNTSATAYSENNSYIDIFFSETNKQRPRCYYIETDNLKDSTISAIPVKISKYSDYYQVLFQYGNLYFDIETKNIPESDLIKLLNSIIKGENHE